MGIAAVSEWNQLSNSLLSAAINIFEIEKFLQSFSVSSISSLDILAVYMHVPSKLVPGTKSIYKLLALLQSVCFSKVEPVLC